LHKTKNQELTSGLHNLYLYNEPTNAQLINIQLFITLPLHVSTLFRHLQGARSQYLLVHKYVNAVLVIHCKTLHMHSQISVT